MDLETLYLFIEVVQQRSFAKVARARNIDPSSVSRAITRLESELGIRLFQRSTRKLEITEIGEIYFQKIVPLVDELESAQQIAIDTHQKPQGNLRVTASSTFAQQRIVPLLPQLAKLYPDLSIELILTDFYLDLIEERIDVAIRLGTLQDSSYMVKHLRKMKFYICASSDYLDKYGQPQTPQNIKDHNCLLFPRARHNLDWLFKDKTEKIAEIKIRGKYLLTNSLAIKQCAIAGMGLALLPDWLVDRELKSGKLIRLFAEYDVTATNFDSSIWLLYPSRAYIPAKTKVFIDYIFDNLGKV